MENFYRPGLEVLDVALMLSWLALRHLDTSNFRQAGKRFLALFLGRSGNRSGGSRQPLAWENDTAEKSLGSWRRELLLAPQKGGRDLWFEVLAQEQTPKQGCVGTRRI